MFYIDSDEIIVCLKITRVTRKQKEVSLFYPLRALNRDNAFIKEQHKGQRQFLLLAIMLGCIQVHYYCSREQIKGTVVLLMI